MFVVAVAMTISASAQAEAGKFTLKPNVGVTYTTGVVDGRINSIEGAFGLTAGVEAMCMLNDKAGLALGLNYTGYDEWAAVVAINKFFEPLHKAYMEATNTTYEIAGRHDAVMKEMEAKTPIGNKAAN